MATGKAKQKLSSQLAPAAPFSSDRIDSFHLIPWNSDLSFLTFLGLISSTSWFLYVYVADRFKQIKLQAFLFMNIGSVFHEDNICDFPARNKSI